ncbi:MAG: aminomethyl transferase family protein [Pseudomonadota bacterium]
MNMSKSITSLESLLSGQDDLVHYFRNKTLAPHSGQRAELTPVPNEHTNWIEEQRAWRNTAILFDQTHHMPEMFLEGPDAFKLLNKIGINSFKNFAPGKAKQFIACSPEGWIIGDCICFYLEDGRFELVSGMTIQDWVEFQAVTGGYDVKITRDLPTSMNPGGRINFRFGMDGPNAETIFREAVDGEAPDMAFFNMAQISIAGVKMRALRHGMAGHKGVELFGPFEAYQKVRNHILSVGAKHGLRAGGRMAYFSASVESGWMAYPLPGIYTGEGTKAFREWLAADSWEAHSVLAGSFVTGNIEQYYTRPWELGYGRFVKFDHDFIGREALEAIHPAKERVRVTLAWDDADFARIQGSMSSRDELPFKHIRMPLAAYGFPQADTLLNDKGEVIGIGKHSSFSANEGKMLTLAMINPEYAEPGTQVTMIWGEPDGGTDKPMVERHRQTEVRMTVGPVPYAKTAQTMRTANLARKAI